MFDIVKSIELSVVFQTACTVVDSLDYEKSFVTKDLNGK